MEETHAYRKGATREKNWKYWYTELFTDHKYIYYFDGSIGTPRKKYNQMIDIKKYPNEKFFLSYMQYNKNDI